MMTAEKLLFRVKNLFKKTTFYICILNRNYVIGCFEKLASICRISNLSSSPGYIPRIKKKKKPTLFQNYFTQFFSRRPIYYFQIE